MRRFKDGTELLLVVALIVACHASKKMDHPPMPAFDKEGHRGCRGLMPENTVPAMLKAIDLGVTTLEMDAVITKDKKVILSHEPFFNHEISTKPDGTAVDEKEERNLNIYKMDFSETQQYDVGKRPHPRFPKQERLPAQKPLLASLIDDVEAYVKLKGIQPVFYNIETKCLPATDGVYHPEPIEFVDLLVGVIRSKNIEGRVIIQSFDYRTLKYLHEKYPSIRTAALVEDFDKKSFSEHLKELGFTPTIYSPHYSLVNEDLVKQCHNKKVKLIPWTVNDKPTIDRLRKIGVDGVISDFPDLY